VLLLVLARFAGSELALAEWGRMAPVTLREPAKAVITCPLPPELFDTARADLADLRVVAGGGRETPYVLSVQRGDSLRTTLPVHLYNRTYLPGRLCRATLDTGARMVKNEMEITTSGANFRRQVLIEASDDGRDWQRVDDHGILYRVTDERGAVFEKNTVAFPENDARYLRISIHPTTDEHAAFEISGVRMWRQRSSPADTVTLKPVVVTQTLEYAGTVTRVDVDFGYKNLPLTTVVLGVKTAHFYRRVTVYARNVTQHTEDVPLEGGATSAITSDEPWTPVADDVLARVNGSAPVAVTFGETRARYLRIQIENDNDPPLSIDGVSATRLVYHLNFPATPRAAYHVYASNPNAAAPTYDLDHYLSDLRRGGTTPAIIGTLATNPLMLARHSAPAAGLSPVFIWLALFITCAVLLLLILRQLRAARAIAPPEH